MLLRRVARPLLAGIFIQSGVAALRDPKTHADMAAPVLDRVTAVAPVEDPPDNVTLVQIDAGVKIGAGVLLAIGKAPRLSSVLLAATLIPTTAAQHRFWETDDPNQRANQQLHFTKNLALLGGLMLASADTEGKPSLAWRARRARRTTAATAELFHRDITEGLGTISGQLSERAGALGGDIAEAASRAGEQAGTYGRDVAARTGERIAPVATKAVTKAQERALTAQERALKAQERFVPAATKAATKAQQKAQQRALKAQERLIPAATRAGERISERAGQLFSDAETVGTTAVDSALEQARRSKTVKDARKAAKKARKRAAKRIDAASKQASKQLDQASKQLELAGKRASDEFDRAGRLASERIGRAG
jgi:uncharacterized membrane protein YphA (DoxX/SURF4 family)